MDLFDPAGEQLRINERYRRMSDEELLALMPQSSELTPFAQQALANEFRSRGLTPEVEAAVESPVTSPHSKPRAALYERQLPKLRDSSSYVAPDPDSPYAEDRKLFELCTVWSVRDALQVQDILDAAGIPFYIGPEKAAGVDQVSSDFAKGLSVQIMRVGWPWASRAMKRYEPADDQTPKEPEEPGEITVQCPRCHSAEVVFEGQTSEPGSTDESSQKFQWSCDACGHHWEDDGVAKEE